MRCALTHTIAVTFNRFNRMVIMKASVNEDKQNRSLLVGELVPLLFFDALFLC